MKRQRYYPSRLGDQVNWLDNFSVKLPIHGTTLGLDPADVTAAVNDAKWGNYVLGTWLSAVRAFSPSTTDAIDLVLEGVGPDDVVLPGFTAPALPAGVTAAPPGLLPRLFNLIGKIKLAGATPRSSAPISASSGRTSPRPPPRDSSSRASRAPIAIV